MVAYRTGQMWPFESTSRSRSSHDGFFGSWRSVWKYRTVKTSAIPSGPAVCPEPAATSISMMDSRISFAVSSSSSLFFSVSMGSTAGETASQASSRGERGSTDNTDELREHLLDFRGGRDQSYGA